MARAASLVRLGLKHEQLKLPPPPDGSNRGDEGRDDTVAEVAYVEINDVEVDELVKMGGLAPSGGNVQAWKVIAYPDRLEFCLDPERAQTFLDVAQTASLFSLGSFIENVCLTADALGLSYDLDVHERGAIGEPVASLRPLARRPAPVEREPLVAEIPRRYTNRRLHVGAPLEQGVLVELGSVIAAWPTVTLRAASDVPTKKQVATRTPDNLQRNGVPTASSATHCRELASRLRELAQRCRFPRAQLVVVQLAIKFEQRAERFEQGSR
jgi:hypothetical protein